MELTIPELIAQMKARKWQTRNGAQLLEALELIQELEESEKE